MEQQFNVVLSSVQSFMVEIAQFLPKLILAVIILLVGWLIAKALLFVVVRGLRFVSFHVLTEKAGLDGFLKKGGIKKNTVDVLGILAYWFAILLTLLATFNSLGLTVVSDVFSRIVLFVPNVIAAVLILAIGLYFARFVADAISTYLRNVGNQDADFIGRVTHYAIAVFVVIMALGQVRVGEYLQ